MREVPDSITDAWLRPDKIGDRRPVVRATVQVQNLHRYEYDTAWGPGGSYNDRHRSGHFRSFLFGDRSGAHEIRNIRSCEWERSVGQDAATCTLTLLNSELTPIGSPRDNPSSPDEFDKPGYMTYNRGDQTISENRWGYNSETGWNGLLVPDMTVKTYEGYGADKSVQPEQDPYLLQSGTWMIDKVTYTSTGDITLEMRDLARLLLDSVVFPPIVPFSEYPLSWVHNHSENVPGRDVTGGSWVDRLNRYGSGSSSNDLYVGEGFTNAPYPKYVGDHGGVEGHNASMPIMNHDGPDDLDKFWRSTGQDAYHDFVWWQYDVDSGRIPVAGLRLRVQGGPFRVYVSIHDGTKWLGKKKIPYEVGTDALSPSSVDIGADIPFVKSMIANRYFQFDTLLPRSYTAKKIRLTFTRLRQVAVGEHPFRAGLREFKIYTAARADDMSFQQGSKLVVVGNYGDYTHIIKWVCAWAGWYWPPHSTGDDFIRVQQGSSGEYEQYVTFVNPDPALPKGRVWGDFMKSGTHGIADLTVDLFDKKPLMDVINYVRDLLGFLFFIDETGGVVWRLPNLGLGGSPKLGNYLSPADFIDIEGNRAPGKRGRHGRTSDIITLDEDTVLTGYQTVLDSQNIRDRIFVANAVGGVGVVAKGFNPYPVGLRRVAGWTDQHFKNKREAKVMADMVSAEQMFTYRVAQAQIPGNPAIQIDDQVRIFERVTNETYYHYVMGIKSVLSMEEDGDWTYDLSTHWLGEDPDDAWTVDIELLDKATKEYLAAVGYSPSDAEDNDTEAVGEIVDRGNGDTTGGEGDGGTVDTGGADSDPGTGGGTSTPTGPVVSGPGSGELFAPPPEGSLYLGMSNLRSSRETYFGTRVAVERTFWNDSPSSTSSAISKANSDIANGRIPWQSFKLRSASWAQAAAGAIDTWLRALCESYNDIGAGPIILTIHHEPNGDGPPASDYLAMYRRLKIITDDYPQILLCPILSAGWSQINQSHLNVGAWMQPDSGDLGGLDCYNPWSSTNGKQYRSVDDTFAKGGVQAVLNLGMVPAIGEFGVRTYTPTPGRSATWLHDAITYNVQAGTYAMSYFDSGANSPDGTWELDKSPSGASETERLVQYDTEINSDRAAFIPLGGVPV